MALSASLVMPFFEGQQLRRIMDEQMVPTEGDESGGNNS
jgi:hypothetical protein